MRASTGFCSDRQSMISAIVEGRSSVNSQRHALPLDPLRAFEAGAYVWLVTSSASRIAKAPRPSGWRASQVLQNLDPWDADQGLTERVRLIRKPALALRAEEPLLIDPDQGSNANACAPPDDWGSFMMSS